MINVFYSPEFDGLSIITIVAVFALGVFMLCYWTYCCIRSACYFNQQTENAAPVCICIIVSIFLASFALVAVIGIWQLYAGLYL